MEYTIQITTVDNHPKLNESAIQIQRLITKLNNFADAEKVLKNTIAYKPETITFAQSLNQAVSDYTTACSTTKDETYNDEQIAELVTEYTTITARADELINDPEIFNVNEVPEFQKIMKRKAELKNIHDKLIAAGWSA